MCSNFHNSQIKSLSVLPGILLSVAPYCSVFAKDGVEKSSKRPNVIIVMTDDQGYGDISAHGNPILQTPQIDKLHKQSVRLTDFHVAPMSTPTRGQLMTGLDAVKNGAVNVSSGRSLLRGELRTMADYYAENGYKTGIFGKWHLGENYPFRPEDRGFMETLWFPSSHIGSVPDFWGNNYFDDVYIRNGERTSFKGYCTDVFFSNAMDWMRECSEEGKPFFTYLPTNTPHQPFIAHDEDIKEMERVVENSQFSTMERSKKHDLIRFFAMIRNIDSNLGKLMNFLEDKGLAGNTILVFLTDNGSTFGQDYYNAGMRGKKTQLYEGGHRVPFFIRWPEGKGFDKPRDIDGLTEVQDVAPTLLELCGIKYKPKFFDGTSLVSVLQGEKQIVEDRMLFINYSRMPFYFDYPSPYSNSIMREDGSAVLWKRWRLLNDTELYNLSIDPLQQNNVIKEYPEIVKYMTAKRNAWWSGVRDVVNKPERIIIGNQKENPSMLTACDWLDVFVDQQAQVERAVRKNSYWLLEVSETGLYEFELRRWPRESNIKLTGKNDKGVALPVSGARISIFSNGKEINATKSIKEDDESVTFSVSLAKGNIVLHTWFDDKSGNSLTGAYYVYVKKR